VGLERSTGTVSLGDPPLRGIRAIRGQSSAFNHSGQRTALPKGWRLFHQPEPLAELAEGFVEGPGDHLEGLFDAEDKGGGKKGDQAG